MQIYVRTLECDALLLTSFVFSAFPLMGEKFTGDDTRWWEEKEGKKYLLIKIMYGDRHGERKADIFLTPALARPCATDFAS